MERNREILMLCCYEPEMVGFSKVVGCATDSTQSGAPMQVPMQLFVMH